MENSNKLILDACCGNKQMWFDKNNPNVEFCDIRQVDLHMYYEKRYFEVSPDTVCDFTALPFPNNTFKLVVFDPPHLVDVGDKSRLFLLYGRLDKNWEPTIYNGFNECMRVLEDYGILVFKWSEVQITLQKILNVIKLKPLFGHRSGKHNRTHWLTFMKYPE